MNVYVAFFHGKKKTIFADHKDVARKIAQEAFEAKAGEKHRVHVFQSRNKPN